MTPARKLPVASAKRGARKVTKPPAKVIPFPRRPDAILVGGVRLPTTKSKAPSKAQQKAREEVLGLLKRNAER